MKLYPHQVATIQALEWAHKNNMRYVIGMGWVTEDEQRREAEKLDDLRQEIQNSGDC